MPNSVTVFITNQSERHKYDTALKYGAIRYVTTGNYPIFKIARLIEDIATALVHSGPDDYLLVSGSAAVAALCLAMWLELHGKCQLLVWDQNAYIKRDVSKSDLRINLERMIDRLEPTKRPDLDG